FCCGTTTSFRNGTMIKCAPRDGIASAIPIQCQYSAGQLFPLFGGGTSKKPQRRASLYRSLEEFIVAHSPERSECRQTHRPPLSFSRRSDPNDARSSPVARRRAAARVVTARTRDS